MKSDSKNSISNTEALLEQSINKLIENLQQGKTEAFETYLKTCATMKYSLNNCILIRIQDPNATLVAGFNDWKKLGRYVKAGEKSHIKILAPMTRSFKKEVTNSTGEVEEKRFSYIYGFKEVSVFDVAQTDGQPLPEYNSIIQGNDFHSQYELISAIMKSDGIIVEETDLGESCFLRGRSFGGRVEINKFLPSNHKLKTLIHEWAHEKIHQGSETDLVANTRALREFEAESCAYIVANMLGLEADTSRDYILGWIKADEFKKEDFVKQLARVSKASFEIYDRICNELEQEVSETNQEDLPMAA